MMTRVKNLVVVTIFGIWKPFLCEAEYCSGYNDIDGVYQGGFHCPLVSDSPENLYCCGTEVEKYCCDTNSNSFLNGMDPAAIVGALLAMVIVLLVFISLCCCCCSCCLWNRRKKNKRGGHVRYNNLDGSINTTVSRAGPSSTPSSTRHSHHQQPSAPPEILSPSSPPFNPHMLQPESQPLNQPVTSTHPMAHPFPPIQTMPPAHPMPVPQPYPSTSYMGGGQPSTSYMGGGQPYPPPSASKEGYPNNLHHPPHTMESPHAMQPPPPYHDHHQIGFRLASGPEPMQYHPEHQSQEPPLPYKH